MIPRPPLPEGPYLVVGLARSGSAVARVLADRSAVIACDADRPAVPELPGVGVHLETDGVDLLESVRTVVKSPGVPHAAPVIARAKALGLEVVGELEIAWRLLPNEFIAITGTNGKTTTTELVAAIHREASTAVAVAGNVGTPLSSFVGQVQNPTVLVVECSSFQLEDAHAFAPECAVLLNVAEDHLDRHGSFAAYMAAKLRIFERQGDDCIAVIPQGFELDSRAQVVSFGGAGADLASRDGALWWRAERLIGTDELRLRGRHNRENAMAAAAASLARGIDTEAVRRALATFRGVEHRLEEVAVRDGVRFYNDSKATNVASTRVALEAFEGGVHLILGGRAKGGGFSALRELVTERCRGVYLIGEAAERAADDLAGTATLKQAETLARAVAAARDAARPGEVILLSPACASFDQYDDYEQRGRHFKSLAGE